MSTIRCIITQEGPYKGMLGVAETLLNGEVSITLDTGTTLDGTQFKWEPVPPRRD